MLQQRLFTRKVLAPVPALAPSSMTQKKKLITSCSPRITASAQTRKLNLSIPSGGIKLLLASSSANSWSYQIRRTLSSGMRHSYRVQLLESGKFLATTFGPFETIANVFRANDLENLILAANSETETSRKSEKIWAKTHTSWSCRVRRLSNLATIYCALNSRPSGMTGYGLKSILDELPHCSRASYPSVLLKTSH